jgi:hypothetical protein
MTKTLDPLWQSHLSERVQQVKQDMFFLLKPFLPKLHGNTAQNLQHIAVGCG